MDKSTTKFCPDCGHHLYRPNTIDWYWCNICGCWYEPEEVLTIEQAQPIRDAWKEEKAGQE